MTHIVIFSHGFGVRKDDRGLFTDIAGYFGDATPILFDYNQFDSSTNTLFATTLEDQVQKLTEVYEKTKSENPEAVVDLVAHSQGCVVVAMARLSGIRKTLFLAPPDAKFGQNIDKKIERMATRPGTEIAKDGTTKYPRRDGSTTMIPDAYWSSRKGVDPMALYKNLAEITELVIVQASHDEVLGETGFADLEGTAKLIAIYAGHDFENEARSKVGELIAAEFAG